MALAAPPAHLSVGSMVFAEVTDATLVTAITSLAGFAAALVWWNLKSADSRAREQREMDERRLLLEGERIHAQVEGNAAMRELGEALRDHMKDETKRSKAMEDAIRKNTKVSTRLVDKLEAFLQKQPQ